MNRILTALSYMILLAIVGAVIGGGYLLYLAIGATIAAIPAVAWLVAGGAVLFAFVFLTVGGAIAIVRRMARSSRYVRPTDGIFPLVDLGGGIFYNGNEPGAQSLAALASGRRPTAALAGRVIDAQYRNVNNSDVPQVAEAQQVLSARDVVDVDPREHPHWLLVGSTGSGKTIASYAVLGELARRAACSFVITEPGGVNWGAQCAATNTADIARAILDVQDQMIQRQALLREHDVDHVQDLPEPLPYLVLVAEETESVLDDLRLTDRPTRDATIIALRSIARMGRKCGVCLVAVTQSGTTDVFDSHVRRNLSNVLLFRSQHTTGETWRVSQSVKLAELPTGAAWSVRHSSVVSFPRMARPVLPQVTTLQPLRTDGAIAVDNWPTTAPTTAVVSGCDGCGPVVQRLEPGREPDTQLAATMRAWYHAGVSKTAICQRVWQYKDGVTWSILDRVLAGEL